jgi:hypothetical protein
MVGARFSKPARPAQPHAKLQRAGDRLRLEYRRWRRSDAFGMGLLIAFSACVATSGKVIDEPGRLYFGLAIASWAALLWKGVRIIRFFIDREELVLDSTGIVFVRRAGLTVLRRVVPLDEVLWFRPCVSGSRTSKGGGIIQGIEARTLGPPVRFAWNFDILELTWLQHELNDHLAGLKGSSETSTDARPTFPPDDETLDCGVEKPVITALTMTSDPVLSPCGSNWRCRIGFGALIFEQPGVLLKVPLGVLFVFSLVWIGFFSFPVMSLIHNAAVPQYSSSRWWGEFVFLVPFAVVIPLVLIWTCLWLLLEPVRRTKWRFSDAEIAFSTTWFGIGTCWIFPIERLGRLELRRTATFETAGPPHYRTVLSAPDPESTQLAVIDSLNTEVCSMKNITEAEARWIGDSIMRARPEWFG